jgi:uncharacterized membrane protein
VTLDGLRLIERVHAVAAWAATFGLVAAAALAASPRRRSLRPVLAMATALLVAAAALGVLLHDPFRYRLRQRLFIEAPALGWLFERKQHAAFAAVMLAVCALAAFFRHERAGTGDEAETLRGTATLAGLAAAGLALAASIASLIVARHAHF